MTEQDKIESKKLFNGIAVIIDDEIAKEDSDIVEIAKQLDEQQIPTLKLSEIPLQPEEFAQNLYGVSILIVDWKFNPLSADDKASGVMSTATLTAEDESEVIAFIKAVLEKTYCPVFIFSQENIEYINERLREAEVITDEKKQIRLFIKSKIDLLGGKLFSEINKWTDSNLPIYVLKVWEEAARKSKLAMFADLESKHDSWPKVIWDTSTSDHTDPSDELSKTLTNIFANRIAFNCQFEKEKFSASDDEIPLEDMRAVLEAERFIKIVDKSCKPAPGDLFEVPEESTGKIFYWINIRAQCALLHIEKPQLYCIRGEILNEERIISAQKEEKSQANKMKNEFDVQFHSKQLHGMEGFAYIPFIINGKILELDFKHFKIKSFEKKFVGQRIGRILPPYITRIQQLFSSYMIREGLPAIPDKAMRL